MLMSPAWMHLLSTNSHSFISLPLSVCYYSLPPDRPKVKTWSVGRLHRTLVLEATQGQSISLCRAAISFQCSQPLCYHKHTLADGKKRVRNQKKTHLVKRSYSSVDFFKKTVHQLERHYLLSHTSKPEQFSSVFLNIKFKYFSQGPSSKLMKNMKM